MKFTKEQHKIWELLFTKQRQNLGIFACQEYMNGFKKLKLSKSRLPSLKELNKKIRPATGWTVFRTKTRYLNDAQWAKHMAQKEFPITNYLRSRKELEFTPEPDMFHDILGHLPFLMEKSVVELIEIFAKGYEKAIKKKKIHELAQLWWNTIEFSAIKEKGNIKIFGTGLMSSFGELNNVINGKSTLQPWSIEKAIRKPRAVTGFHPEMLVIDSIEKVKEELNHFVSSM